MRRGAGFLSAGILLLVSAAGRADIVPVSQARSVQVSASETYVQDGSPGSDQKSDSQAAADFQPFATSLTAPTHFSLGSGTADQASQIGPTLVNANGHVTTLGSSTPTGNAHLQGAGSGTGSTSFSLTFDLTEPTTVNLNALLISDGSNLPDGMNLASMKLTGPMGAIFDLSTTSPISKNTIPFTYADQLGAGRYTVEASALGTAPPPVAPGVSGTENASFEFTLQVPEPSWLCTQLGAMVMLMRRRVTHRGQSNSKPAVRWRAAKPRAAERRAFASRKRTRRTASPTRTDRRPTCT